MTANQVCASLDFGNKNVVIGLPEKGSINIILNEASNRLTPAIVSYSKSRRYFGVHAQTNQLENVKGTIFNLKRFVCLKYDDPEREYLSKIVPFSLAPLNDGFTGIKIKYNDDDSEKVLRPEQLIAYLIKSSFDLIQKNNQKITSIVIAVSPWWTEMHRRAIFDACEIASVPCPALVNSTTAAAVNYTINHRQKLPEGDQRPVNVIFIDFGDSTLNVAVSKLTQKSLEISSFACDEHLGGSNFTDKLSAYLVGRIKEKLQKNDEDFKTLFGTNHERALVRFHKAAEDLKKKLSVNQVVQFETHSFMPDNEFNFNVTREEFESQIVDLIQRIDEPVKEALELAKIKTEDIFAIECLGGTSRIPIVKKKLSEIFGPNRELSQSLDLDECFAVGTGYIAALLSSGFSLSQPLTIKDVLDEENAVNAAWMEGTTKMVCEAFPSLTAVPSRCRIPVKTTKEATVTLYSEACEIFEVKIELDEPEELENPVKVSLRLQLTQSSTLSIIEATYQLPVKDQETTTTEENKDETKSEETNNNNTITKKARISFKSLIGLSREDIELFKKEELELENRDDLENKIDETRNELESTIFEAENGLNRDFPEYFEPEKLEENKEKISKIHEWFTDNEFDRLSLKDYQERLETVRNIAEPAIKRFKTFKKIFDMENSLKSKAPSLLEKLKDFAEKSKNDTVALVRDEFQIYMTKFEENFEKVKEMNKFENPDFFNIDEVCSLFNNFEQKTKEFEEMIKQEEENAKKKGKWCNIQ